MRRLFDSAIWLPAFVRDGMVSEPLIWGKLPSRADYIRHQLKHEQIAGLQEWIRAQMSAPTVAAVQSSGIDGMVVRQVRKKHDSHACLWHSLVPEPVLPSPVSALAAASVLPWCFVLPPGTLPFARKQHLIGIWMASSDKIGRRYPLVMMQTASPRWIRQYFSQHVTYPCDWLYFAARCLAQAVYAEETEQDRPCSPQVDHVAVLVRQLAQLWTLYRPGWRSALGGGMPVVAPAWAQDIVGAAHPEDVVGSFDGVRYLPWADWPQRLMLADAAPVFWQQDLRGRFVNVAQTLASLPKEA